MSLRDSRHDLAALLSLLVACGGEPTPLDASSPVAARASVSAASESPTTASAAASPSAAPKASNAQATPPLGSPEVCPRNDGTGIPLAKSSFASLLPIDDALGELEATNDICGDTWCEGSFEWFFYDLRSDNAKSELTMRVYDEHHGSKAADASKLVVKGPGYIGRVLGQKIVPACTAPCGAYGTPPRWAPCLTLDLRCELAFPWTRPFQGVGGAFVDCGMALERALREIHPD